MTTDACGSRLGSFLETVMNNRFLLLVLPAPGLTDEPVTFVPSGCRLSRQNTRLDPPKRLEHALDVVVRQVGVDGRHVDPVEGARFLRQLVDDWLSLADVAGPPDLRDGPERMTASPGPTAALQSHLP